MHTVIMGGGASGLACAIRIKQNAPNMQVTVLEKLETAAKKISATGNGRCNLTNTNAKNYNITREFFESIGLLMREESDGRIYPYSNQASTVANLLIDECKRLNIKTVTGCNVFRTEEFAGKYMIYSDKSVITCDFFVLATGGKSQKSLGSDGSGYKTAKAFGHTVTSLYPSLVQLTSSSKNCRLLKGVRMKCLIKLEINGEITHKEYGELLFTDYGISGIAVMNLSRYIKEDLIENGSQKCCAIIDFFPNMSEDDLYNYCKRFNGFESALPSKLNKILFNQSGGDLKKAAKYAKSWKLIITGTKGFEFSQVTNGGVKRSELKSDFESVFNKNLYIIGELTDNQFPCGGYNLNFAFSSGIIAADSIAEKSKKQQKRYRV